MMKRSGMYRRLEDLEFLFEVPLVKKEDAIHAFLSNRKEMVIKNWDFGPESGWPGQPTRVATKEFRRSNAEGAPSRNSQKKAPMDRGTEGPPKSEALGPTKRLAPPKRMSIWVRNSQASEESKAFPSLNRESSQYFSNQKEQKLCSLAMASQAPPSVSNALFQTLRAQRLQKGSVRPVGPASKTQESNSLLPNRSTSYLRKSMKRVIHDMKAFEDDVQQVRAAVVEGQRAILTQTTRRLSYLQTKFNQ